MASRDVLAAFAVGVGLAGTLDEVVLHQLLHWHHFYDRSTSAWGLVSDGVFHIVSTALLVWGSVVLVRDRRELVAREALGWVVLALGTFNLYDGTVQHKVFRLHQVREHVGNEVPYDAGFLALAALVAGAGALLVAAARRRERQGAGSGA